jgi:hypothetical protein
VLSFRKFVERVAQERWVRFWGVLGSIAAVLGLVVLVVSYVFPVNLDSGATPTSKAPLSIKIDPVRSPVSRCATFTGEDDVPADRTLWLAARTAQDEFFFSPVVVDPAEHNWISDNVHIGGPATPPGTILTVYTVLVDDVTDQLLRQGRFAGGIPDLPDGFDLVDQIQVTRSSESAKCSA